ncbi:hypothetical protein F5884DRAFT_857255 [Xylogone sp. PMI_703]|nr:hypothetical protein F5884DRAFT_857255 [Xylogone sp. PMI_703]
MRRIFWLGLICLWKNIPPTVNKLVAPKLEPVQLHDNPSFVPSIDVSVVVPTVSPGNSFERALLTWLANRPLEIIIVTTIHFEDLVQARVANALKGTSSASTAIKVVSIPVAEKRRQHAQGIREAQGSIIVLVDDDVFWSTKLLLLVLACFEDSKVGAVGTKLKWDLTYNNIYPNSTWGHISASILDSWNNELSTMNHLDKSVTVLSSRTVACRSSNLKSSSFLHAFTHEYWFGNILGPEMANLSHGGYYLQTGILKYRQILRPT